MTEIPLLLLAAGSSARMGQPKQLLAWGNTTLIEHQIITLIETGYPVNVVLGCNSNLIIPVIAKYKINKIINEKWEKGMGSSISCGISHIKKKFPKATGVLITLLDQPMVTASYLQMMFAAYSPGVKQIIVSHSDSGWKGVPALFDKFYFKYLLKLNHDEGAKNIIYQFEENIIKFKFNDLIEDMDTPESYQLLLGKYFNQSS